MIRYCGAAASPWAAGAQQAIAKRKTLLVVGSHMDDCEAIAGGVILKAVHDGLRVVLVQAVSDWSNWPPAQGREKKVAAGVERIAKEFGFEKILLGYKYHHVPVDHDLKLRIARIVDEVRPDIAIIMSESDYWTDHANIARAAKDGIMFPHGYLARVVPSPRVILAGSASPHQTHDFQPDTYVDISPYVRSYAAMLDSLDALLTDSSPVVSTLSLKGSEPIEMSHGTEKAVTQRSVWGDMCGVRFAEAFRAIRKPPAELW